MPSLLWTVGVVRRHLERLAVLLGGGGVAAPRHVGGGPAHGLLPLEHARRAGPHGLGGDRPRGQLDHVEDALAGRRVREQLQGERLPLGEELRRREARAGAERGGRRAARALAPLLELALDRRPVERLERRPGRAGRRPSSPPPPGSRSRRRVSRSHSTRLTEFERGSAASPIASDGPLAPGAHEREADRRPVLERGEGEALVRARGGGEPRRQHQRRGRCVFIAASPPARSPPWP